MANPSGASFSKSGSTRAARTKTKVMTLHRGSDRVTFRAVDRRTTEMRTSRGVSVRVSAREGRARAARLLLPAGGFKIAKKRK